MLHRFFTGLHRRCSLFARDFHFLFVNRKLSVANCYALIFAIAIVAGCSKPSAPTSESDSKAADTSTNILQAVSEPLLKFHWIGKKRLATEANATNFMAIWNLPESARLEAQTLDKLATAPWRLWQTNVALSNAPSNLLRTLLDDLVQEEVYVEATGGSNQISELVIALRLPDDRAALWETNLPIVLNSLSKLNLALDRSSQSAAAPNWQLSLTRTGYWTFVSVARPVTDSLLVQTFASRIAANGAPYAPRATNYWIEGEVDGREFSKVFDLDWDLPDTFPEARLEIIGDGQNIRTRGELRFASLGLTNLPDWNLPFHLTVEPLTGFNAMRCYKPVLKQLGILNESQAAKFPEQFLSWLRSGPPLQIYFAFPFNGAEDAFTTFITPIVSWINSHADPSQFGMVEFDEADFQWNWKRLQFAVPFIKLIQSDAGFIVYGGFGLTPKTHTTLPVPLHQYVLESTNLLYFDWEHTQNTVSQWRYFDDSIRMIFDAAHASRFRSSQAAIAWFHTNLTLTNFSHSVTEVRVEDFNRLLFTRRSSVGFTAVELDILANWLEMPEFPAGISSLWRTNPAPFVRPRRNPSAIPLN